MTSPTAVTKFKDKFGENPVGTGPFKFVKWEQGDNVTLEANPEYWDEKPYIDRLIFKVIPNDSLRLFSLQNGKVDMLSLLNPKYLPVVENDKNIKTAQQPGINIACLAMNNNRKPFSDVRVRLAVYHAINKDRIIDNAYREIARVAKNPIPPMLLGYQEAIKDYNYDPKKAKRLLEEAGYTKIDKVKFFVPPIARPYIPNPQIVAEIIKDNLKEIGIEVEFVSPEWRLYLRQLSKGEDDMALIGWIADIPDPDNFFAVLLNKATLSNLESNNNWAFYNSNEMYELILKGKTALDKTQRGEIYKQACEVFHKDVPWVPLAHTSVVIPMLYDVMDFKPGLAAAGSRRLSKVWLNR
jgi:ABC-type transport system substrate-binding protein